MVPTQCHVGRICVVVQNNFQPCRKIFHTRAGMLVLLTVDAANSRRKAS